MHAVQNAAGARSSVTSNSRAAVNVERPAATADCRIQFSGNMSFQFGIMTRSKVAKDTNTAWTQAILRRYRAIPLADINLVSEKLPCAYVVRYPAHNRLRID